MVGSGRAAGGDRVREARGGRTLTAVEIERIASALDIGGAVALPGSTGGDVLGRGTASASRLGRGLRLTRWTVRFSREVSGRLVAPRGLMVQVQTRGTSAAHGVEGRWGYELCAGDATVVSRDEPQPCTVSVAGGHEVHGLTLLMEPGWIEELGSSDPELAEGAWREWRTPSSVRFRASPVLMTLANAVLVHGADDGIDRLRLESRVLDILAEALSAVRQDKRPEIRPSRTSVERAERAASILLQRLADPPGLAELARLVGGNQRHLARAFAAVTGHTPAGFVLEHRMQVALLMLRGGADSVAQVAYAVGYSSPDNFSTAFRRRFGVTPSSVRNRR